VLPAEITHLFWEYDPRKLRWPRDRDLVLSKILTRGTWNDIRWLRGTVSDDELRAYLLRTRGRGLSPQQLRYWQLMLDLPGEEVDRWLAEPGRQIWHGRVRRNLASQRSR